MKVLLLNGSANQKGCTYTALEEIGRTLQTEGIGYEIFQTGARPVRDCIGCGQCTAKGRRTVLCAVRLCTMPMPAGVSFLFWIGPFTAVRTPLYISLPLRLLRPAGQVLQPRWMT